jgi:hypothetical protein
MFDTVDSILKNTVRVSREEREGMKLENRNITASMGDPFQEAETNVLFTR